MSINYRTDYFQFETLTAIRGEPDFESILKLNNEIKANAQSVPTTLGGGNHGLLGLVITPEEYALVSNVPFTREPHPGPLTFPPGTTALQSKVHEDAHKKRFHLYNACVGVEKALIQQLVKAVEEDWLTPLRNQTTNALQGTIPDIVAYLFTTHGDISPESLIKREQQVKTMEYRPDTEPVDKVFTEVTQLIDYASAAGAPYTRPQTLNIAYVILKNTRVFNNAIKAWNRLIRATPNQATWANFKRHFRESYKELKEVEELRVGDTQFNSANLVHQIVEAVQDSLPPPSINDEVPFPLPTPTLVEHTPLQQANALVPSTSSSPEMQALLQQMMLLNSNFVNSAQPHGHDPYSAPGRGSYGRSRGRNGARGNIRGRGRGRSGHSNSSRGARPPRVMRYCWSCGWCTHDGAHCHYPNEGHNSEATIENRMGGSTAGFPPNYE